MITSTALNTLTYRGRVFDDDISSPILLGSTEFSLLPYFAVKPDQAKDEVFDLTSIQADGSTVAAGGLVMKVVC